MADITTGLILHHTYNDIDVTSAIAYDRSGNASTGTLVNSPTKAPGKIGRGLLLNGSNQYVTVADAAPVDVGNVMTFALWLKRDRIGQNYETICSKGANSAVIVIGALGGNLVEFYGSTLGQIAVSTVSIADTTLFHHVVVGKDGATTKIYIDNVDVTGTVTDRTLASNANPLYIGVDQSAGPAPTAGSYFKGTFNDVRQYNRLLTADDVAMLYGLPGSPLLRKNVLRPRVFAPGLAR